MKSPAARHKSVHSIQLPLLSDPPRTPKPNPGFLGGGSLLLERARGRAGYLVLSGGGGRPALKELRAEPPSPSSAFERFCAFVGPPEAGTSQSFPGFSTPPFDAATSAGRGRKMLVRGSLIPPARPGVLRTPPQRVGYPQGWVSL